MKRLLPWIILGLAIRLVIIPISLHPDFRAVNLAAYLIAQKGEILGFYDHISKLPRKDSLVLLYGDNLFIYPPLAYLTHAVFNKVLYPLYPQNTFWLLINDIGKVRGAPDFWLLMYFLKLPYLIADFACGVVLYRFLAPKYKYIGTLLWIFNPVSLYVSYALSQFDIFLCFFLLLTLFFVSKKRYFWSAVSLGLAAGFKPFPLLLLPLLPGSKLKNILIGLATYVVLIAPYLGSPAFKQYALLAGQSDKLLYAKIMVSGSQFLPLFVVSLVFLYWLNLVRQYLLDDWVWLTGGLLLFFALSNYHPQWFIWLSPFLVLSAIYRRSAVLPVIGLLLSYVLVVLLFDPSLNFGLFGLNFSFSQLVSRYYSPDVLASLARGVFAGAALSLLLTYQNEPRHIGQTG